MGLSLAHFDQNSRECDNLKSMFSGFNTLGQFTTKNFIIWLIMAFQAGVINAGGFLASHRFVTHVTGFGTHFGAELAQGHVGASFGILMVPGFFLFGAMISAFFVDRNIALGKRPFYELCFALITLFMLVVSVAGSDGFFGGFGAPLSVFTDYLLLAILCLSAGLQNATITSASGAVVRTTHLTGMTTDLGIGLVRVFTSGQSERVKKNEQRNNLMRAGIIGSFALGSTFAAFIFLRFEYWGFLIPAIISGYLTYGIARRSSHEGRK